VLAFPQVILATIALKAVSHHLQTIIQGRPTFNALNGLGLIAAIWFLILLPYQWQVNQESLYAPTEETDMEVITYLNENVSDERYIITDEPLLAVVTDKKLVPILSDTSNVRLKIGHLTKMQMITLTEQYQPQVIIFGWDQRFATHLPGYLEWVKMHYQLYPLEHEGNLLFIEEPQN